MKKSMAIAGAGTLGLVAAGAGAATPAVAADVTTPCATFGDHVFAAPGETPDNWFAECVPQYGIGKAEFTISSDIDFPGGFAPLDDPSVTITTEYGDEAAAYFGNDDDTAPFFDLSFNPDGSTPASQRYDANIAAPVTGVASAGGWSDLPEEIQLACEGSVPFAQAHVATFGSAGATFSQVVDGEEWVYDVRVTPDPVYFLLTLDAENGGTYADICITDGERTFVGQGEGGEFEAREVPPFVPDPSGPWAEYIGDFPRVTVTPEPTTPPAPVPMPEEPEAPELAATGLEVAPLVGSGISLLGLGLLALTGRRRKTADS